MYGCTSTAPTGLRRCWSDRLLEEQKAFVVPSSHAGETVLRFAIISPLTTFETLTEILDTLR